MKKQFHLPEGKALSMVIAYAKELAEARDPTNASGL